MTTQYYTVELHGELEGMFQSDSAELAAIQIVKLKIVQPQLVIKNINAKQYRDLLKAAKGDSTLN